MTSPNFQMVDYLGVARSRVTEQLKDQDIFDRYLQLMIEAQTEIQDVLQDLIQLRDIDSATGAQLDIIGDIVGQERVLLNADLYKFFGFKGALKAASFGDGTGLVGGKFHSFGAPTGGNILLDDGDYRLFLKAKIYKNTSSSTPEEFIAALNLIFNTSKTLLMENSGEISADVIVLFSRPLTDFEKGLLNYVDTTSNTSSGFIPKTVGVNVRYGEYKRTDLPISYANLYDGSFNYDGSQVYDSQQSYAEHFNSSNIEYTLY